MCSKCYPGEIFIENASFIAWSLCTHGEAYASCRKCTTAETTRTRTRAKVVISCSTFSNADHGYIATARCFFNFGSIGNACQTQLLVPFTGGMTQGDLLAMHAKLNCLCRLLLAWHRGRQQFVFGMIFAFRTACLPSASTAGPRNSPAMQCAPGLLWSLTSSCFRAISAHKNVPPEAPIGEACLQGPSRVWSQACRDAS